MPKINAEPIQKLKASSTVVYKLNFWTQITILTPCKTLSKEGILVDPLGQYFFFSLLLLHLAGDGDRNDSINTTFLMPSSTLFCRRCNKSKRGHYSVLYFLESNNKMQSAKEVNLVLFWLCVFFNNKEERSKTTSLTLLS